MSGAPDAGSSDALAGTMPSPMSYVVDTSVALKWYIPEVGSAEARHYMGPGIDRHAPDLLPLEGAHALLGSVNGFVAGRIFLGITEGGNFPAAVKVIAQWFPKSERALATALFNSGANVGAVGAPFFIAWLLEHGTWRSPFYIAAAAGLVWVVRATAPNRALVARYPEVFGSRFPGSSGGWVEALAAGSEPPTQTGLVWCDIEATRLFGWRRPASRGTSV